MGSCTGGAFGGGFGFPFMAAGMGVSALFWISLLVVAVWAIKRFTDRSGHHESTPLDVLKARLARGEINETEFHAIRSALSSGQ